VGTDGKQGVALRVWYLREVVWEFPERAVSNITEGAGGDESLYLCGFGGGQS
jgi:hypothetical protein